MPDNDTSETLHSFENSSYIPLASSTHTTAFVEAESLLVRRDEESINDPTAYTNNFLHPHEAAEYTSFDIPLRNIDTPWETAGRRESLNPIPSARDFGWHFETFDANTSDVLVNNIEQFMVDEDDAIPEGDLSGDLFEDDRFSPEPITEDHRQLPNGVLVETDGTIVEVEPENAVVIPSTSNRVIYLVCQDYNILLNTADSVSGTTVRNVETFMAASVTNSTDIYPEQDVLVIQNSADVQLSEFMATLDDDIRFTHINIGDCVVFETETIRENQIMVERYTGQVYDKLTNHGPVKGYVVETEDGTEVDIPATAVVWAEPSIDNIPAWAM